MKKTTKLLFMPFERTLAQILVVALTIILFTQIVNRYVFSTSFVWMEEIARISFVWLIYFCVAAAARENSHIRIGLIDMFLPERAIRVVNFIADAIVIAFSFVIVWLGILLMRSTIEFDERTPVTEIPMWIIYAVIPVCFALIAARVLGYNLRDIFGKFQGQADTAEDPPHSYGE